MLEPPIQREVYTLTTWSAQPADGDGEANGADGAPAPAKKKRGKAELRAQLEGETDPYRLLELEELRWRATQDDVRKAYRRLVLLHHPDKQDAAKAKAERAEAAAAKARDADGDGDDDDDADAKKADDDEDEGDEMFRAITGAFELLSNEKKRRDFDSLDDFDDSIPRDFDPATDDFFKEFGPVFERNSRWSELQPAPLLGDASAPFDDVAEFYNFWFAFKSWRDFADADEYDVGEAGFREEKRWMERENEKLRKKKRKDEQKRIEKLVELSYKDDPRVKAQTESEKAAKAAAKAERAAKLEADREAEAKAKAAAAAAAAEAEAAAAERQREEAAERKRQKEKEAKALRKQRARLRAACKEHSLCDDDACEKLCARLPTARLESLCAELEELCVTDGAAATARVAREVEVEAAAEAATKTAAASARSVLLVLAEALVACLRSHASTSASAVSWSISRPNFSFSEAMYFRTMSSRSAISMPSSVVSGTSIAICCRAHSRWFASASGVSRFVPNSPPGPNMLLPPPCSPPSPSAARRTKARPRRPRMERCVRKGTDCTRRPPHRPARSATTASVANRDGSMHGARRIVLILGPRGQRGAEQSRSH